MMMAVQSSGGDALKQTSAGQSFMKLSGLVAPWDGQKIRKRKRALACPVCKLIHNDGSIVPDGSVCKAGHMRINNAKKEWQCLQACSN